MSLLRAFTSLSLGATRMGLLRTSSIGIRHFVTLDDNASVEKLLQHSKDKINYADPSFQTSALREKYTAGISQNDVKNQSNSVQLTLSLMNASQKEIFKHEIQETIQKFKRKENDTGSCEVQVAIMTKSITHLTEHMKMHRKDFSTLRKLLIFVGKRKRLLRYLRKTDLERYVTLVKRLGLPGN